MHDPLAPVERRIVDNRLFIIGLDALYRSAMAKFETTRLLECARTVARELGAAPSAVPVEGYYVESPALTEYFQLMRTLQELEGSAAGRVRHLPEFSLLHAIATSGLYGQAEGDYLLPRGKDALFRALEGITASEWTVTRLVERARTVATDTDDFSLVALAARTGDAVCLAATRESVALYSRVCVLSDESPGAVYDWQVDHQLSAAANRFIQTLNQFGASPMPAAEAASAADYYEAAMDAELAGRCVAIGFDPATSRYYHWAVAGESIPELHVREFWDPELWTTARHKSQGQIISGW